MATRLERTVGTASGLAVLAAGVLAARPWYLRWGATDEEIAETWPGDELSPTAASVATRAVTIHAPAAAVWPWLMQIGQDRGGFYSYTWLENLLGAHMRNADRILPEHQSRQVGDTVWMAPREKHRGQACMKVARLDPERALVLVSPEDYHAIAWRGIALQGTWAILLAPVAAHATRLVVRTRSGPRPGLFHYLVFDPVHFVMERKMMLGIRRRAQAEAARQGRAPAA